MKVKINGRFYDAEKIMVGPLLRADLKERGFDGTAWIVTRGQFGALAYRLPNGSFSIFNPKAMAR